LRAEFCHRGKHPLPLTVWAGTVAHGYGPQCSVEVMGEAPTQASIHS